MKMEEYHIIVVGEEDINRGLNDDQLARLAKANHVIMRKQDRTFRLLKDKWQGGNNPKVEIYVILCKV